MSTLEIPRIEHPARRDRECARFILSIATDENVFVATVDAERESPGVVAWAPDATNRKRQLECERSLKRTVSRNLRALARHGLSGRNGRGISFHRALRWRRS